VDLKEIGWDGFDWIHIAQNSGKMRAVLNRVMNCRITKNAENVLVS
jgi:hypothetical protein